MDGRKAFTAVAVLKDTSYTKIGVHVSEVTVLDEKRRIVEHAHGYVHQLLSGDDLYATRAEALMAGAQKLQAEGARLTAAAVAAADEAAQLAAEGGISVCST